MRSLRAFLFAIILTQAVGMNHVSAHFSTPSFQTKSFSPTNVTHSDAPLPSQTHNVSSFISRGNPNLYNRDRADELRYRNANYKSRCLGLENKDSRFGTQNSDIPNMQLKFHNPRLRSLNFNAD